MAARASKRLPRVGMAYFVTVDRVRFQVATKARWDAFTSDAAYVVYFVRNPPTHTILSAEALDE